MRKPLVTIIISTYNAEKFVEQTLKSILNQTYTNTEIIIRDDNSADNTVKVLEKYTDNILLIRGIKNIGPYASYNIMIKKAQGKYISIVDHDDIYHPDKIFRQINFLEKNKEYIGCGTLAVKYFENSKKISFTKYKPVGEFTPHPSLIFLNNDQQYDTNVKWKTDTYFMKKLCEHNRKLYTLQEHLYLSRVRADNKNLNNQWGTLKNILTYVKKEKNLKIRLKVFLQYITPAIIKRAHSKEKLYNLNKLTESNLTKSYDEYLK